MTRVRSQLGAAMALFWVLGFAAAPALACVKVNGFKPVCFLVPGALDEIKMRLEGYSNQNSFLKAVAPASDLQKNCVTIDGNKSCGFTSGQINDLKGFVDQSKRSK
jgi:hypothetical protein